MVNYTFSNLPKEWIWDICSFLNLGDVSRVSCVNKRTADFLLRSSDYCATRCGQMFGRQAGEQIVSWYKEKHDEEPETAAVDWLRVLKWGHVDVPYYSWKELRRHKHPLFVDLFLKRWQVPPGPGTGERRLFHLHVEGERVKLVGTFPQRQLSLGGPEGEMNDLFHNLRQLKTVEHPHVLAVAGVGFLGPTQELIVNWAEDMPPTSLFNMIGDNVEPDFLDSPTTMIQMARAAKACLLAGMRRLFLTTVQFRYFASPQPHLKLAFPLISNRLPVRFLPPETIRDISMKGVGNTESSVCWTLGVCFVTMIERQRLPFLSIQDELSVATSILYKSLTPLNMTKRSSPSFEQLLASMCTRDPSTRISIDTVVGTLTNMKEPLYKK